MIATQLANILGYDEAHIVIGTGLEAAEYIASHQLEIRYILLVIGERYDKVPQELDALAEQCLHGTEVVVAGTKNDIRFYRSLIDQGVLEYFTLPIDIGEVARSYSRSHRVTSSDSHRVIAFRSASAGDGSSTVALNTAYTLARDHQATTAIVDLDYQFGMVAKNLDLSPGNGSKEVFEHPDRGIDATLVNRMAVSYGGRLDVIASPNELRFYPEIKPESIREFIFVLQQQYQFVILDLPHIWMPWIASALNSAHRIELTAQLWLKSVTHASRFLYALRDMSIDTDKIDVIINRSGARFKEGITPRDFERVCQKKIEFFLPNDTRIAANAENMGKTIMEMPASKLAEAVRQIASNLYEQSAGLKR